MSLMPFKGRCIHCGHDHGNSEFYGDDPIRYQERLKAQSTLEKVAVHVLEKQIATLTRQRDLAVEALKEMLEYAGIIEERCDSIATDKARAAIKESEAK